MTMLKKSLISVFIAVHVIMMVTAALPDRSAVGDQVLRFLSAYQVFFGLDQTWSMFAPNPASVNSYLTATLTFKDGSTEQWTFPRASQLDDMERFTAGERYRKYQQENLLPMEKEELWFDLSRYVAREVEHIEQQGRGRQLQELYFYRHFNVVAPPSQVFIPHGKMSTQYTTETVFHFKPTGGPRYEASNNH
ncbi:hypothetical protein EZJ49_16350 [Bdellovibrio bacteriovorus]|uniref:hypothetical protein n=1 Tax=Bdellovibrio bacteriovorus TaxID=959 RepID=UPI0021D22475|nr:hypothetical protein [Bdellovibrio bacteriovorus]UXR64633.1 hypothetical protein EZJ49_16350 [Bdellovibrio bacteriovorus]